MSTIIRFGTAVLIVGTAYLAWRPPTSMLRVSVWVMWGLFIFAAGFGWAGWLDRRARQRQMDMWVRINKLGQR